MSSLTKIVASTAAVAGVLTTSALAEDEATRIILPPHAQIMQQLNDSGIQGQEVVELDVPEGLPEQAVVNIPIQGTTYRINLYRYSLRSADFELIVDDGQQLNLTEPSPSQTYRGTVDGIADTSARASLLEDGLYAMVDLGDEDGTWFIQPVSSLEPDGLVPPNGTTEKTHVITPAQSSFPEGYMCGNDIYGMNKSVEIEESNEDGGIAGALLYVTEVAMDTDYEFFQANGSSVNGTINDIELIWNFVENIYERDVSITFEISTIVVRSSSSDPYSSSTNANTILNEFSSRWNQSSNPEFYIKRDVAQIFTGKNVAGGTIGLASVGVVCNTGFAYGMVESRFTTNLTFRSALSAHELGHNYNSLHCDSASECRIMCSGLGACDSISGSNLKFSPTAINSIVNYRSSMSCDTIFDEEITLPYFDDLESLSQNNWVYNKGVSVSTLGQNEPSGTRSMALDSSGSGLYQDDEIRSCEILASGYDPLFISFYTQHEGVEADKSLIVEYTNSSGDWVSLTEIVSDGTNQSEFVFHQFEMGSSAQTNRLRLRFRTNGDSSNDNWYVDSLTIGDEVVTNPPPDNDNCVSAELVAEGTTIYSTLGATTTNEPGCDGIEQDIWFYFVSPTVGDAIVTLCGSTLDTEMAVYNALFGCPYQESHVIECQDDSSECGDDPYVQFSTADYPAVYIRIGGAETGDGQLLTIAVSEPPEKCPADLNGDNVVDGADLSFILGNWGTANADLDGNGTTDGADLSVVLGSWGACP